MDESVMKKKTNRFPFKKTADGQNTRKVKEILSCLEAYLNSLPQKPNELVLTDEAAEALLNPHYDGTPTYRDIPIVTEATA